MRLRSTAPWLRRGRWCIGDIQVSSCLCVCATQGAPGISFEKHGHGELWIQALRLCSRHGRVNSPMSASPCLPTMLDSRHLIPHHGLVSCPLRCAASSRLVLPMDPHTHRPQPWWAWLDSGHLLVAGQHHCRIPTCSLSNTRPC